MDFDAVLDGSIALLKKHGRVTLRTLKRQFSIDDRALEDLINELVKGQRIARLEEDEVLVLTGPVEPRSLSGPAQAPSDPGAVPSTPIPAPAGRPTWALRADQPEMARPERRQITVMFCDLVGSTALSALLDPEDLRQFIQRYQATADKPIREYEGYVAQYLGDGIMAYFGFPQAHEDDAERAVRAGFGLLAAVAALSEETERTHGVRLSVRVGVHTGLVVVGEMGQGAGKQNLALGQAPNVAARVQSVAAEGTLVVSDATFRMIQSRFDFEDLGVHELRGISGPVRLRRVSGIREVFPSDSSECAITGRTQELDTLRALWQESIDGTGGAAVISGEAGIGKSRLVRALRGGLGDADASVTVRCSPYRTNTALYPLAEFLERRLGQAREGSPKARIEALRAHAESVGLSIEKAVPIFAGLLGLGHPEGYPALGLSPKRMRQLTLDVLHVWIQSVSGGRPLLMMWEDVHWADATTLDLLGTVLRAAPAQRALHLVTHRPEFRVPWDLGGAVVTLRLGRLNKGDVSAMVMGARGLRLSAEVLDLLVDKTDGVPLFVEEVTTLLIESGRLREHEGQLVPCGSLGELSVPSTLQDSLMSRLDRMDEAREIAQLGATIGREFTLDLLEAVSDLPASTVRSSLRRLMDAELIFEGTWPSRYIFKHALIQDVAYQSLLRSTRQTFHGRIAQALEERFPDVASGQPELLGHHYSSAGQSERAIPCLRRAGEDALRKSAYTEAVGHFTRCMAEVQRLPETPERTELDLALQIALAVPLTAIRGYSAPEVRAVYARARELCEHLGESRQMFAALYGMWRSCLLRAEYKTGLEIGAQLGDIAARHGAKALSIAAQRVVSATLFYTADFPSSLRGSLAVIAANDVEGLVREDASTYEVVDPFVAARAYAAWDAWMLGRESEASSYSASSVAVADRLGQGFSRAFSLSFATWLHQFRRCPEATLETARAALEVSQEQGLGMWLGWNHVLEGWALARLGGDLDAQADRIRLGIDEWRATGSELGMSYYLALLAEVEDLRGRPEAGLAVLLDAEASADQTHERFVVPEILRLRGVLSARAGRGQMEAQRWMDAALAAARDSGAVLFELRSLMSRAELTGAAEDLTRVASRLDQILQAGADPASSDVMAACRLVGKDSATRGEVPDRAGKVSALER